MKRIRTLAEIETIQETSKINHFYIETLKSEFVRWFEAEGAGESMDTFELSGGSSIYHLEDTKDSSFIADNILSIEYVDVGEKEDLTYFRIGLMNDHEMSIIYFIKGTLGDEIEQWLKEFGGHHV